MITEHQDSVQFVCGRTSGRGIFSEFTDERENNPAIKHKRQFVVDYDVLTDEMRAEDAPDLVIGKMKYNILHIVENKVCWLAVLHLNKGQQV